MTVKPQATCVSCADPTGSNTPGRVGDKQGAMCTDCAFWADGNTTETADLAKGTRVTVDVPEFPGAPGVVTSPPAVEYGLLTVWVALDCRPHDPEGLPFVARCVTPLEVGAR